MYELASPGLPYCGKELLRKQGWNWVFERKTAFALKETLENEDMKVIK